MTSFLALGINGIMFFFKYFIEKTQKNELYLIISSSPPDPPLHKIEMWNMKYRWIQKPSPFYGEGAQSAGEAATRNSRELINEIPNND